MALNRKGFSAGRRTSLNGPGVALTFEAEPGWGACMARIQCL